MPDSKMTDNQNPGFRSRLGRRRPHALRFGVNPIGRTLFLVLIALGPAEGFSPASEALSVRALGAVFPVSQPYGAVDKEVNSTPGGVHAGIDFAAPFGTTVRTVSDGTVIYAGGPYGTVAVFDGTTLYLHMKNIDLSNLHKHVAQGTYLGTVAREGATGVHLHVEVRKGGSPLTAYLVGVGCTKEEYRKTPGKSQTPSSKGYCESFRQVADLTLDPVEYFVGGKQQEAKRPATRTEKTVKDEGINVTWSVKAHWASGECGKEGWEHLDVEGRVPATVDLTDNRIAKMFIDMGKEYGNAYCRRKEGWKNVRSVFLFTPTYQNGQEVAVDAYLEFGGYNAKNYIAWHTCWIKPFLHKYGVAAWISQESVRPFISNPFQWKGKIVGLSAEFNRMIEETKGAFSILNDGRVIVTGLPSTRFVKPEAVLLAGRVQGVTEGVPVLVFVGAVPAPPPIDWVHNTPPCSK